MTSRRVRSVRWALIPATLVLLAAVPFAWRASFVLSAEPLKIGPETTYVTGPIKPDGSIDYPAALHERLSVDVKPEENAAILIDRAFGPSVISPELRSLYFSRIGAKPLPEQGDYVVTQTSFTQSKIKDAENPSELNGTILDELARATARPWTRADCPLAAEWLDANAAPLKLIEQASLRPKYYSPLVTKGGILEAESTVQNLREAARLLAARAMLRLGTNDFEGAWSDLLSCHRLARLAGQRPASLIYYLVAVALDAVAAGGDAALMGHGLSSNQARKCLADHARLPAMSSLSEVIDHCERLVALDGTQETCKSSGLDVNTMLRRMNQTYDDLVATLKQDSHAGRTAAIAVIEAELAKRAAAARQPLSIVAGLVSGRAIANSVSNTLLKLLMPAMLQANIAQSRTQVRSDLVRIGFALAACRADLGAWPSSLTELVPKYLDELPVDRFTGQPLLYVPRTDGFLIYSAGPNGRDDAGQTRGPNMEDDIPLEVGHPREVAR